MYEKTEASIVCFNAIKKYDKRGLKVVLKQPHPQQTKQLLMRRHKWDKNAGKALIIWNTRAFTPN